MSLFVSSPSKNLWTDLHDQWLKMHEIRQECVFSKFCKKNLPPPTIPQIMKILHYKSPFSLKTHKSWQKRHQNSYSNRKHPTAISNLGLKIWPEVEFWLFLHMRSRKLAKNTGTSGPISKISHYVANWAWRTQILGLNFTPEVVIWPFLHMHAKSGQNVSKCSQIGKNWGSVRNWQPGSQ